jgi:hypothetical protein
MLGPPSHPRRNPQGRPQEGYPEGRTPIEVTKWISSKVSPKGSPKGVPERVVSRGAFHKGFPEGGNIFVPPRCPPMVVLQVGVKQMGSRNGCLQMVVPRGCSAKGGPSRASPQWVPKGVPQGGSSGLNTQVVSPKWDHGSVVPQGGSPNGCTTRFSPKVSPKVFPQGGSAKIVRERGLAMGSVEPRGLAPKVGPPIMSPDGVYPCGAQRGFPQKGSLEGSPNWARLGGSAEGFLRARSANGDPQRGSCLCSLQRRRWSVSASWFPPGVSVDWRQQRGFLRSVPRVECPKRIADCGAAMVTTFVLLRGCPERWPPRLSTVGDLPPVIQ